MVILVDYVSVLLWLLLLQVRFTSLLLLCRFMNLYNASDPCLLIQQNMHRTLQCASMIVKALPKSKYLKGKFDPVRNFLTIFL